MKYYIIYEIKFIIQISKLDHFIEQMSTKNIEENIRRKIQYCLVMFYPLVTLGYDTILMLMSNDDDT